METNSQNNFTEEELELVVFGSEKKDVKSEFDSKKPSCCVYEKPSIIINE